MKCPFLTSGFFYSFLLWQYFETILALYIVFTYDRMELLTFVFFYEVALVIGNIFYAKSQNKLFKSLSKSSSEFNMNLNKYLSVCMCAQLLSYSQLFVTLQTVVHQAPLSMGISRQEYRSGLPFSPQRMFLTQGSNPGPLHILHWQAGSLPPLGKPKQLLMNSKTVYSKLILYQWTTNSMDMSLCKL